MAISFDATGNSGFVNSAIATSMSWTQTISGNFLTVGTVLYTGNNTGTGIVLLVTCNGIPLDNIYHVPPTLTSDYSSYDFWYLTGPPTGLQTIVAYFSQTLGSGNYGLGCSASFLGVDQTNPIDNYASTSAPPSSNGAVSLNLTTVNSNAWIVDVYNTDGGGTLQQAIPNSPQMQIYNSSSSLSRGTNLGMSYNGPIVTPGLTADGWTTYQNLGNREIYLFVLSIKPEVITTITNFNTVLVVN